MPSSSKLDSRLHDQHGREHVNWDERQLHARSDALDLEKQERDSQPIFGRRIIRWRGFAFSGEGQGGILLKVIRRNQGVWGAKPECPSRRKRYLA